MTISLKDEARMIEAEALRRAVLCTDSFVDEGRLRPAQLRDLRLMLARRYDRFIEKYNLDTHELMEERVRAEYANGA